MDSYFDKATGQNFEALVTPVGTPSRKASSKKLAAKSSNPTQLLAKMSSVASEVVEGVEELLNEKFEEPDSWYFRVLSDENDWKADFVNVIIWLAECILCAISC